MKGLLNITGATNDLTAKSELSVPSVFPNIQQPNFLEISNPWNKFETAEQYYDSVNRYVRQLREGSLTESDFDKLYRQKGVSHHTYEEVKKKYAISIHQDEYKRGQFHEVMASETILSLAERQAFKDWINKEDNYKKVEAWKNDIYRKTDLKHFRELLDAQEKTWTDFDRMQFHVLREESKGGDAENIFEMKRTASPKMIPELHAFLALIDATTQLALGKKGISIELIQQNFTNDEVYQEYKEIRERLLKVSKAIQLELLTWKIPTLSGEGSEKKFRSWSFEIENVDYINHLLEGYNPFEDAAFSIELFQKNFLKSASILKSFKERKFPETIQLIKEQFPYYAPGEIHLSLNLMLSYTYLCDGQYENALKTLHEVHFLYGEPDFTKQAKDFAEAKLYFVKTTFDEKNEEKEFKKSLEKVKNKKELVEIVNKYEKNKLYDFFINRLIQETDLKDEKKISTVGVLIKDAAKYGKSFRDVEEIFKEKHELYPYSKVMYIINIYFLLMEKGKYTEVIKAIKSMENKHLLKKGDYIQDPKIITIFKDISRLAKAKLYKINMQSIQQDIDLEETILTQEKTIPKSNSNYWAPLQNLEKSDDKSSHLKNKKRAESRKSNNVQASSSKTGMQVKDQSRHMNKNLQYRFSDKTADFKAWTTNRKNAEKLEAVLHEFETQPLNEKVKKIFLNNNEEIGKVVSLAIDKFRQDGPYEELMLVLSKYLSKQNMRHAAEIIILMTQVLEDRHESLIEQATSYKSTLDVNISPNILELFDDFILYAKAKLYFGRTWIDPKKDFEDWVGRKGHISALGDLDRSMREELSKPIDVGLEDGISILKEKGIEKYKEDYLFLLEAKKVLSEKNLQEGIDWLEKKISEESGISEAQRTMKPVFIHLLLRAGAYEDVARLLRIKGEFTEIYRFAQMKQYQFDIMAEEEKEFKAWVSIEENAMLLKENIELTKQQHKNFNQNPEKSFLDTWKFLKGDDSSMLTQLERQMSSKLQLIVQKRDPLQIIQFVDQYWSVISQSSKLEILFHAVRFVSLIDKNKYERALIEAVRIGTPEQKNIAKRIVQALLYGYYFEERNSFEGIITPLRDVVMTYLGPVLIGIFEMGTYLVRRTFININKEKKELIEKINAIDSFLDAFKDELSLRSMKGQSTTKMKMDVTQASDADWRSTRNTLSPTIEEIENAMYEVYFEKKKETLLSILSNIEKEQKFLSEKEKKNNESFKESLEQLKYVRGKRNVRLEGALETLEKSINEFKEDVDKNVRFKKAQEILLATIEKVAEEKNKKNPHSEMKELLKSFKPKAEKLEIEKISTDDELNKKRKAIQAIANKVGSINDYYKAQRLLIELLQSLIKEALPKLPSPLSAELIKFSESIKQEAKNYSDIISRISFKDRGEKDFLGEKNKITTFINNTIKKINREIQIAEDKPTLDIEKPLLIAQLDKLYKEIKPVAEQQGGRGSNLGPKRDFIFKEYAPLKEEIEASQLLVELEKLKEKVENKKASLFEQREIKKTTENKKNTKEPIKKSRKINFWNDIFKDLYFQETDLKQEIFLPGLVRERIIGDGHCLYTSVGIYCGMSAKDLRNAVADFLGKESNSEARESITVLLGTEGRPKTLKDYIKSLRDGFEWADHLEIQILSQVLGRNILVVGADKKISNTFEIDNFSNMPPIFVYNNGIDHYDALILQPGYSGNQVLEMLKNQRTSPREDTLERISINEKNQPQKTIYSHNYLSLLEELRESDGQDFYTVILEYLDLKLENIPKKHEMDPSGLFYGVFSQLQGFIQEYFFDERDKIAIENYDAFVEHMIKRMGGNAKSLQDEEGRSVFALAYFDWIQHVFSKTEYKFGMDLTVVKQDKGKVLPVDTSDLDTYKTENNGINIPLGLLLYVDKNGVEKYQAIVPMLRSSNRAKNQKEIFHSQKPTIILPRQMKNEQEIISWFNSVEKFLLEKDSDKQARSLVNSNLTKDHWLYRQFLLYLIFRALFDIESEDIEFKTIKDTLRRVLAHHLLTDIPLLEDIVNELLSMESRDGHFSSLSEKASFKKLEEIDAAVWSFGKFYLPMYTEEQEGFTKQVIQEQLNLIGMLSKLKLEENVIISLKMSFVIIGEFTRYLNREERKELENRIAKYLPKDKKNDKAPLNFVTFCRELRNGFAHGIHKKDNNPLKLEENVLIFASAVEIELEEKLTLKKMYKIISSSSAVSTVGQSGERLFNEKKLLKPEQLDFEKQNDPRSLEVVFSSFEKAEDKKQLLQPEALDSKQDKPRVVLPFFEKAFKKVKEKTQKKLAKEKSQTTTDNIQNAPSSSSKLGQ